MLPNYYISSRSASEHISAKLNVSSYWRRHGLPTRGWAIWAQCSCWMKIKKF